MNRRFFSEARTIIKLGLPVIGAQMSYVLMGMIDTIMAGNLSADDLAAIAVGGNIVIIPFLFGMGILMAVNPIVAQHDGAGNTGEIGRETRHALWLSQMIAIPIIFGIRFTEPVIDLMGLEPDVAAKTFGYMKAYSLGLSPALASIALRYYCEGLGKTVPGLLVSVLGLPFNVLGNYTLLYGNFGFPQMGAVGTGWATSIVFLITFFAMLGYTYFSPALKKYGVYDSIKIPKWSYFRELLRIGIPNGLSFMMEVSCFAIVALLIGSLGTIQVAAHQIAINVAAFTFMIPFGLSTAITIRVGNAVGRGELKMAQFSGRVGIVLAATVMSLTALTFFLIPDLITGMYTDNPEVQTLATLLLYHAAVFQISDGLQVSGLGALRGLKDTRVPMIVNFISYWMIGLTVGSFFGFYMEMGPRGFWIGLISGLSVAAVLHNTRFYMLIRKMKRTAGQFD